MQLIPYSTTSVAPARQKLSKKVFKQGAGIKQGERKNALGHSA
jgi:hypothetical protein